MIDKSQYKNRLLEYLNKNNIEVKNNRLKCPNPSHNDNKPSAYFYDNSGENTVYCAACGETWDIFSIASMLHNVERFEDQIKDVQNTVGGYIVQEKKTTRPPKKQSHKECNILDSGTIYSEEKINSLAEYANWGKLIKSWNFRDERGNLLAKDCRFEGENGKIVLTLWYDGKNIKASNPPSLVYNRHLLYRNPDKKVLIVEGCKSADEAECLKEFVPVTWNGGTNKIEKPDWTVLAGRDIYFYPDDDRKRHENKLLPEKKQPGIKAAIKLKELLPNLKIVRPLKEARKVKSDGADIVEALQVIGPNELIEYILDKKNLLKTGKDKIVIGDDLKLPFKILGISDDGKMNFTGIGGRIVSTTVKGLSKNVAMSIVKYDWLLQSFSIDGYIQWDAFFAFVIQESHKLDFDANKIRGNGAWRNNDGELLYYNGGKFIGASDDVNTYIRSPQKEIGLHANVIQNIGEYSSLLARMSFNSIIDRARCLGWSLLAPFAGALDWRPSIFLTGDSESGKSTIANRIIKPLAMAYVYTGSSGTAKGVRQDIGYDARAVIVDEMEPDSKDKRKKNAEFLTLMRESTTKDAPIAVLGGKDGKPVKFNLNSMFCFGAISSEMEHAADENRVFRVCLRKPSGDWQEISEDITRLFTSESCKSIRAKTWGQLEYILNKAVSFSQMLSEKLEISTRRAFAESMLQVAYWSIFHDVKFDRESSEDILGVISSAILDEKEYAVTGNDFIDDLMDQMIFIDTSERRDRVTLREILIGIKTGHIYDDGDFSMSGKDKAYLRGVAGRYGVSYVKDKGIAIANNHKEIMSSTGHTKGYCIELARSELAIQKNYPAKIAGKTRKCVLIKDILDD